MEEAIVERAADFAERVRKFRNEIARGTGRDGCWIHCYPDPDRSALSFIVRDSFASGALGSSSKLTATESDTECFLVAAGADPDEAHARVQEAIERGNAFLTIR